VFSNRDAHELYLHGLHHLKQPWRLSTPDAFVNFNTEHSPRLSGKRTAPVFQGFNPPQNAARQIRLLHREIPRNAIMVVRSFRAFASMKLLGFRPRALSRFRDHGKQRLAPPPAVTARALKPAIHGIGFSPLRRSLPF